MTEKMLETYKTEKMLVTAKKAGTITGVSKSFFYKLMREGLLKRYKIHTRTFISLLEFESIATTEKQKP